MKESGLQIIACTDKSQEKMYKTDYSKPSAIIVGSEEDGISPEFLKMSDFKAKIPIHGKIGSLNVSVATGIILYEVIRQRK
jgi:23S rRNA (guanosine2251-2'-O)-methyltransferase